MRGRVLRILVAAAIGTGLVLALTVFLLFPEGKGYFDHRI